MKTIYLIIEEYTSTQFDRKFFSVIAAFEDPIDAEVKLYDIQEKYHFSSSYVHRIEKVKLN